MHLQARLRIHDAYRRFASGFCWQGQARRAEPAFWLNVALFAQRDAVAAALTRAGIETRPVFYPLHHLPPYGALGRPEAYPVARHVSARGLCLPSHAGLTTEDVHGICELAQAVVAEAVSEAVAV